ncbi:MAG: neutral zinc metallopeptidase, partial [Methylococcaceae bacterium]
MLFKNGRESQNVEDRRSQGGRGGLLGGGRSLGVGTLLLILAGAYFGLDPRLILAVLEPTGAPTSEMRREAPRPPANDQEAHFVSLVLQDTEVTFGDLFQRHGLRYQDPKLVLFSGATPTACGMGQSAMGPFYCPPDQKVYIDLRFYDDLKKRFGAPGDFAQAYVVAHEVGHHVQNLLGIQDKVQGMKARLRPLEANQLSVRMELQ